MLQNTATRRIMQIGAGGVGCPISQHLNLIADELIIIDGDTYEPQNADRQPLAVRNNGANKAIVTVDNLPAVGCKVSAIPEMIDQTSLESYVEEYKPTLIFSCVDNDKAREAIFTHNKKIPIIWGANEVWDPQAGLSTPEWCWNPMEFFEAAEGNDTGCGAQTMHANMAAANYAMMLLNLHLAKQEQEEAKKGNLPIFIARVSGGEYKLLAKELPK